MAKYYLQLVLFACALVSRISAFTIPSSQKAHHCHGCTTTTTSCAMKTSTESNTSDQQNRRENNGTLSNNPGSDRRRSMFTTVSAAVMGAISTANIAPSTAEAAITEESNWPLWTALPVAPYSRRRTIRYEVGPEVFAFDQLIGIYYVHVPIRMIALPVHQDDENKRGLMVYAPVAPTKECLSLMQELIDMYGPVRDIIDPSTAVEHKVNAGPFARAFPAANFWVTDKQYAFPLNLPDSFLGLPSWAKPLPRTSRGTDMWGGEIEHEVLTVKPGIGSMFQDVALYHKKSKTVLICDALFAVTEEPPRILTEEEEYTRALLFHARESKDEVVEDTPENRRKGWRRIVLLFDFFFPGSGRGDLGIGPILEALKTPTYKDGWGGWKPFSWGEDEVKDFQRFSASGKPTVLPIIQIILARGPEEVQRWLGVVTKWKFKRVVPMHLDAPLAIGPSEFANTFDFTKSGKNEVRFCDEDVQFLRKAEEGPLNFSVYKSTLGTLRGEPCGLRKPPES